MVDANMAMERTFDAMMAADASDDQDISGCYAWVITDHGSLWRDGALAHE